MAEQLLRHPPAPKHCWGEVGMRLCSPDCGQSYRPASGAPAPRSVGLKHAVLRAVGCLGFPSPYPLSLPPHRHCRRAAAIFHSRLIGFACF